MAIQLNQAQTALIEGQEPFAEKPKALEVKNLTISFHTDAGKVQAVRGVSFDLYKGETLCIVGESGSGKSVTNKAIMGILSPNAIVEDGSILYEGEDLLRVSEEEFHRIRGKKIGMIFQDPLSSLNPIVKIGKQITEAMLIESNQVAKYRRDTYAPQLTAVKNAKVACKAEIEHAKVAYKNLIASSSKEEAALKAEIRNLKKNNDPSCATKEAELQAKAQQNAEAIAQAKQHYQEVSANQKALLKEKLPGLKQALRQAKGESKSKTEAHLADLKKELDAKLAEIDEKEKALVLSEKDKARIAELEAQIASLKKEEKTKVILSYFLNKHKQALRAQYAEKLNPLQEERDKLAKESDEIAQARFQAEEDYNFHIKITKAMAKRKALQVMREVGIPQPEARYKQYPFQFSGGMRQRIVIAIALIAEPDILICDEPTTALDVTIQAQILELINRLKVAHNMSVIFITHDLGVVANMADRVAVMYAGKIVEYGTDKEIFFDPRHPYTWALLSSIPDIDSKEKLEAIPGTPRI